VGLDTHVQDIVNVLFYEDLTDVILVGHSYGGMVITGVPDKVPERIKHLVYLDAMVPSDGDSILSLVSNPGAPPPAWNTPGAVSVPVGPTNFGVEDPDEVTWLRSHMVPQPLGGMTQPSRQASPIESKPFPLTYILAAGKDGASAAPPFQRVADRIRNDNRWRLHTLNTGHDVMVTMPNQLAGILLALAWREE